MRVAIGLAVALLWAVPAHTQTPPDTFKAGIGVALHGFYLGDQVDDERVAILLPEAVYGSTIYSIRASIKPPNTGAVDPEMWANTALFTWGLSVGTSEQPLLATSNQVTVPLKNDPDLRMGGWATAQTEWPVVHAGQNWLVGYWNKNAKYVRLGQNMRDTSCTIAIGYKQAGVESWQTWPSSGLEIEIAYGAAGQGVPSGVFDDPPTDRATSSQQVRAAFTGSDLTVAVPLSNSPTHLQVVNILGQTVVSHTGYADFGEVRVPWSASHPSGVYFCRIRSGTEIYVVPIVSVK